MVANWTKNSYADNVYRICLSTTLRFDEELNFSFIRCGNHKVWRQLTNDKSIWSKLEIIRFYFIASILYLFYISHCFYNSSIFESKPYTMSSLNLGFDLEEALKRTKISSNVLSELRKAKIPGMPESITDQQLLLFYDACQKDFEETKETIQNYYEHKRSSPEHFVNRDPASDKIKQCLDNQWVMIS